MAPEASNDEVVRHTRSRTGCYTCRLRKVKCRKDDSSTVPECANCTRLRLECRWRAPEPHEEYAPPPKKRRTIGERRRHASVDRASLSVLSPSDSISVAVQDEVSATIQPGPSAEQLPADTFDIFGDLPFDFDSYSAFGPVDVDGEGENLDFIPLPTIDPSTTQTGQDPYTAVALPPVAHGRSQQQCSDDDTRRLIQHYHVMMNGYENVMCRPIDTHNLFVSAFSMSLSFPPLYYAALSFSASHLAMEDSTYLKAASTFEQLAEGSYKAHRRHVPLAIDGLLSTLFVLAKRIYITADNVDKFLELMSQAVELISQPEVEETLKDHTSLARRVVIRLAILDSRAAQYRLGGGTLVEHLRTLPALTSTFNIMKVHRTSSPADVTCLLRVELVRMRVSVMDQRLHKQLHDEFVTTKPVRNAEIEDLYKDIRQCIASWDELVPEEDDEDLSLDTYGHLTVSQALHSALLYLHTIYPLPQHDSEASVTAILCGQLKVCHDPTRACCPSAVLPSALFLAGICTTDPIRRLWVAERFRAPECWGSHTAKIRELFQGIINKQVDDSFVDVQTVMRATTGTFIM